jgi:succinate dehydrogenase flavin-adding protein (antitoxin of CptAB toxin-antitoxin module)
MADLIQSGYVVDGQFFATKAEAQAYLRRPKVLEALNKLFGNEPNADLAQWLLENQESLEEAFDTGTVRMVRKTERNQLNKAGEALKEFFADPANAEIRKKAAFIADNLDVIVEVFRWPKVARLKEEEKAAAIATAVGELTKDDEDKVNEDLVAWIVDNQAGILEAFEAGVEKRAVDPKATDALAAYRLKKATETLEAAKASGDAEKLAKAQASFDKANAAVNG